MSRLTQIERFNKYVSPEPMSGCWLWTGWLSPKGYGYFRLARPFMTGAHRASWTIFKGQIPDKMSVLHKCDVRCCVNPDHLFLGTQDDNMKDAQAKGRTSKKGGVRNPNVKLNEDEVRFIRASTLLTGELAKKFSVSLGTVNMIRRGATWKELLDEDFLAVPEQHARNVLNGDV